MTDTDRTLLVLAFALIVVGYAACQMALELYREIRRGIRTWRVHQEIAAVGRPTRDRLPRLLLGVGQEHRDGSK